MAAEQGVSHSTGKTSPRPGTGSVSEGLYTLNIEVESSGWRGKRPPQRRVWGEWLLICLHIEKVGNGNGTEDDAQGDRRARHGADDGDLLLLDCIKATWLELRGRSWIVWPNDLAHLHPVQPAPGGARAAVWAGVTVEGLATPSPIRRPARAPRDAAPR